MSKDNKTPLLSPTLADDEATSLRILEQAFSAAGLKLPFFGECYEPGTVIESIVAQVTALRSSPQAGAGERRWTHVKHAPPVGGLYLVGGYVTDAALPRYFGHTFAFCCLTLDGPEWSHRIEDRSYIPIEYWSALGAHPEHTAAPQPSEPLPAGEVAGLVNELRAEVADKGRSRSNAEANRLLARSLAAIETLTASLAAAKAAGIEEAAKVAEQFYDNPPVRYSPNETCARIANAIRALATRTEEKKS